MKLEDQVVGLPLAKKLKDLGVKQKSLWYWNRNFFGSGKWYLDQICIKKRPTIMNNGICSCCYRPINRNGECDCSYWDAADNWGGWKIEPESYSAFTVAELGEMLPSILVLKGEAQCRKGNHFNNIEHWKDNNEKYYCGITSVYDDDCACSFNHTVSFSDKKEANARAKMLIYLIKNKLIKV